VGSEAFWAEKQVEWRNPGTRDLDGGADSLGRLTACCTSFLKSYELPADIYPKRWNMRLLLLVVSGLGGYFLFIGFLCRFLTLGRRSDEIRSQLLAEWGHFKKEKSKSANEPQVAPLALGYFGA
jgi:hypothetical protein